VVAPSDETGLPRGGVPGKQGEGSRSARRKKHSLEPKATGRSQKGQDVERASVGGLEGTGSQRCGSSSPTARSPHPGISPKDVEWQAPGGGREGCRAERQGGRQAPAGHKPKGQSTWLAQDKANLAERSGRTTCPHGDPTKNREDCAPGPAILRLGMPTARQSNSGLVWALTTVALAAG
jgi:hypothetical protein